MREEISTHRVSQLIPINGFEILTVILQQLFYQPHDIIDDNYYLSSLFYNYISYNPDKFSQSTRIHLGYPIEIQ